MDTPKTKWRIGDNGLLSPEGIQLDGMFYPSSVSSFHERAREKMMEMRVGIMPDYKELWPNRDESIDELIAMMSLDKWLGAFTRLSTGLT